MTSKQASKQPVGRFVAAITGVVACGCQAAPAHDVERTEALESAAELPLSEDAHFVSSTEGMSVAERFYRIPPEVAEARRATVAARAAEDRGEPSEEDDRVREALRVRGAEEVEVTFDLPQDSLPSLEGLTRASDAIRGARISEREAAVARSQEPLLAELHARGARGFSTLWLSNSVSATLSAREALALWDRHPDAHLSLNGAVALETDGLGVRVSAGVGRLVTAGFHGDPAGTPRYRIAIIEGQMDGGNWPTLRNHVAFRESAADATSRIALVRDCNVCALYDVYGNCSQWICANRGTPYTSVSLHGDRVAFRALGSIEEGQDVSVTNPLERTRRSGAAPEVDAMYIGVSDCQATARALQDAVYLGADVANMSYKHPGVANCDRSGDCGGVNAALTSAFSAGLVIVKSAGNEGSSTGNDCTLTYPAWRPEVIAVGGLNGNPAVPGGTSNYSTAPRFYDPVVGVGSSTGGVQVRYTLAIGTFTESVAALGLMTWGTYDVNPQTGTPTFNVVSFSTGTSFSAPTVAGTAALMAHSMSTSGGISSAGQAMTNVLLMGDASAPGGTLSVGLSSQFGFGRMRASTGSGSVLTAPWGWGSRTITGGTGVRVFTVGSAGPEASGTREWRWVTASMETTLNALRTDYTIQVVDACPPGGGRLVVAADESFDPRKRIQLSEAQICPAGAPTCRCLEMEILVHEAPPAGVTIHASDFYHGGDPNVF